jgi:hypothetical protein
LIAETFIADFQFIYLQFTRVLGVVCAGVTPEGEKMLLAFSYTRNIYNHQYKRKGKQTSRTGLLEEKLEKPHLPWMENQDLETQNSWNQIE